MYHEVRAVGGEGNAIRDVPRPRCAICSQAITRDMHARAALHEVEEEEERVRARWCFALTETPRPPALPLPPLASPRHATSSDRSRQHLRTISRRHRD